LIALAVSYRAERRARREYNQAALTWPPGAVPRVESQALRNLGLDRLCCGDPPAARRYLQAALDVAVETGGVLGQAQIWQGLAEAWLAEEQAGPARAAAEHGLRLAQETEAREWIATAATDEPGAWPDRVGRRRGRCPAHCRCPANW
jgi:hypothetical protein